MEAKQDNRFPPEPGQQTFEAEHWRCVASDLCMFGVVSLEALYKGSHSATFAADLRAMLRQVVNPERVEEWES